MIFLHTREIFKLQYFFFNFISSEESKPDSDLDEDTWIMTVKGMNAHSKSSSNQVFTLDDNSPFNNGSPNSIGSPSRDVNLNHLNIVSPSMTTTNSPRSPSAHNQSQGFSSSSSPSNSPTPDTLQMSPSSQKSIVHLKEKQAKDERYVIESTTIEMVKHEEFVLKKSPEKEFVMERQVKDVRENFVIILIFFLILKNSQKLIYFFRCTKTTQ